MVLKRITTTKTLLYKDLLRSYDFQHVDEFDVPLVEGVERGFFDEAAVKRQANELGNRLKLGDSDAVLDSMVESVKANVGAISPLNLSGTVGFLKEFGRGEQAIELVRFYVDNRLEKPGFWDLRDHPFFGNITDPDVRDALSKRNSPRMQSRRIQRKY